MKVLLVMFKSDGTRREFTLTSDRVVVGRKTDCDLRIPLSSVSRHHCELKVDPDEEQLVLRDLGSSNGTYHNNIRVQEAVLEAGDEIRVGPVVFIVVIDGEPEQIQPVRTVISEAERSGGVSDDPGAVESDAFDADDSGQTLPPLAEGDNQTATVDLDDPMFDDPVDALQHMAEDNEGEGDAAEGSDRLPAVEDDEPDRRHS